MIFHWGGVWMILGLTLGCVAFVAAVCVICAAIDRLGKRYPTLAIALFVALGAAFLGLMAGVRA